METDRVANEMQPIDEPKIKLIEQIKTEPMDMDLDRKPLIPQFTYGNRKKYVKKHPFSDFFFKISFHFIFLNFKRSINKNPFHNSRRQK